MEPGLVDIFLEIGKRGNWGKGFEKPEELSARIECYSKKLMNEFDTHSVWRFQLQLINWLENVNKLKDKYLLLNSLSYFTFFNREQCNALYREALYGPTYKWLIDIKNYEITDPKLNNKLNKSIDQTCFSAATDSMDIATFRHVCGNVKTLHQTWFAYVNRKDSRKKIKEKVELCKKDLNDRKFKQIVVLDDFIGTGRQTEGVIDFLGYFQEWPILFIPLLVCPQGDFAISEHLREKRLQHISYEPVSILPWELILADDRLPDSKPYLPQLDNLKKFAEAIHEKIFDKDDPKVLGYLGYGDIGALFAKYSNCPNNTLPLYHDESNRWIPLFKRSKRK